MVSAMGGAVTAVAMDTAQDLVSVMAIDTVVSMATMNKRTINYEHNQTSYGDTDGSGDSLGYGWGCGDGWGYHYGEGGGIGNGGGYGYGRICTNSGDGHGNGYGYGNGDGAGSGYHDGFEGDCLESI